MPRFFSFFLVYFQRLCLGKSQPSRTCVATLSSWHMLIIRASEQESERAGRQSQSENTNSIKLFKNNFYLLPTRFICCRCLCRCGLSTLARPLPIAPLPMYIYDIGNRELELGAGVGGILMRNRCAGTEMRPPLGIHFQISSSVPTTVSR